MSLGGTTTWLPAHGGEEKCWRPLTWLGEPVYIRVQTDGAGMAIDVRLVTCCHGMNLAETVPDEAVLVCEVHGSQRTAGEYRQEAQERNERFDRENPLVLA